MLISSIQFQNRISFSKFWNFILVSSTWVYIYFTFDNLWPPTKIFMFMRLCIYNTTICLQFTINVFTLTEIEMPKTCSTAKHLAGKIQCVLNKLENYMENRSQSKSVVNLCKNIWLVEKFEWQIFLKIVCVCPSFVYNTVIKTIVWFSLIFVGASADAVGLMSIIFCLNWNWPTSFYKMVIDTTHMHMIILHSYSYFVGFYYHSYLHSKIGHRKFLHDLYLWATSSSK